jgi:hypothetical protein
MATKIDEYGGWKGLLLFTLLSSLISGSVIAGVLKWGLDHQIEGWKATRTWQTSALSEAIAPTVMHLARTNALGNRYRQNPRYGEALLLKESNSAVRAVLLTKSHLLPSRLIKPSQCLLTHYDIWLQRFDLSLVEYKRLHNNSEPTPEEPFDVGFSSLESAECGGFPKEAPKAFQEEFDGLRKMLFDLPPADVGG